MVDQYFQQETTNSGFQQRNPIMYHEQIDQMILTPEAQTTSMVKKVPKMIKKPVYKLDEKGNQIPILDEEGNQIHDERGIPLYKIERYEIIQDGYTAKAELIPSSEILFVDYGTSNLSYDACSQLARTGFLYNRFLFKQNKTSTDYSNYLHKLRNDNLIILNSFKSYNGGTIQAIKTFINKTDEKQWIRPLEDGQKKASPFGFFGGKKEEPEKKYTGFQP